MYRLKLTARAKRELKNIKKIHQEAIGAIFEEIKESPFVGKPLSKELFGKYSYRVGIYRIIYKVNPRDKIVIIITAGHRSIIYK